jgi:hypothetical protein
MDALDNTGPDGDGILPKKPSQRQVNFLGVRPEEGADGTLPQQSSPRPQRQPPLVKQNSLMLHDEAGQAAADGGAAAAAASEDHDDDTPV